MDSFAYGKPHASLSRWVERYIGYRTSGRAPGVHRGLPSRHPTFIVAIGDPIDVIQQTDLGQAPGAYGAVLSGLQPRHALIASGGREEGVAIEMTPAGFRALFGLPAAELWNATFELSDVTGAVATELWERLQEPTNWTERFAICDEVLGRQIGDAAVRQEVERAWNLLVLTAGNSSVDWIASQVGLSRQALTRRFRGEFGLSPKLAGRIIRFERANNLLGGGDGPSIAEVAAACGYFDQAHMNRDFVEFAGLPPGKLRVEEEVPSFQDSAMTPAG